MVRVIALAALLALLGYAQTPASVIEQLTTPGPFDPFFSCSKSNAGYDNGRFLARRLVNLGGPAIPAIEAALDRYEGPEGMKNADGLVWLLFAYAKLEGPSAVTRLRRFSGIADPEFYATPIDSAVALARNLTSFVSSSRVTRFHKEYQCRSGNTSTLQTTPCDDPEQEMPMRTLRCDRGSEPRDALDELIVALYVGRESQVRVQLGPVAQASLDKLISSKAVSIPSSDTAIGYTLDIDGAWSEPNETLEEGRRRGNRAEFPYRFPIQTRFTTSNGAECGRLAVTFSRVRIAQFDSPSDYKVDNENLPDLIGLLRSCAVKP